MEVGNDGGPFCGESGCNFDLNSKYSGSIPSGVSTTWTMIVWATFSESNIEGLIGVQVS